MPPKKRIEMTGRDYDALGLLVDGHTPEQLQRRSQCFNVPFESMEYLEKRLRAFRDWQLVRSFKYHFVDATYYKLTRKGFQLKFPKEELPKAKYFAEVSYSSEPHFYELIETIASLEELLTTSDVRPAEVTIEPRIYIKEKNGEFLVFDHKEMGSQLFLEPDAHMLVPGLDHMGKPCMDEFFFEYDRSTETLQSQKSLKALSRRVQQYDRYALRSDKKFRTLFVLQSEIRMQHFLKMVKETLTNPKGRTLIYATTVQQINEATSAHNLNFLDHRQNACTLVEKRLYTLDQSTKKELAHAL